MITAPAIEVSKAVPPEIAHSLPIVKDLSEATAAGPLTISKPAVKAYGFESAETAATGPTHGPLATGSFDFSQPEGSAPARPTLIAPPSAFSDVLAPSSPVAQPRSIISGTFGDSVVETRATANGQKTVSSTSLPVEILSKPRPAYTGEGRAKNIEGEVLLEVQFSISGEVRVLRVVHGLGHGLDDTAIAAARGIRFRPAMRDGGAVDSSAIVHIVFQLAN